MKLSEVWGVMRGFMIDNFSFSDIKNIVGQAGLPIHKLSHLKQGFGGTSNGQLMDNIENLYSDLSEKEKEKFITYCIEEVLIQREGLESELERLLERVGWGISEKEPYPLELQIEFDTAEFSEVIRNDVKKGLKRFRDGDMTGAVTAFCGAVDNITANIYETNALGNHENASYQKKGLEYQ